MSITFPVGTPDEGDTFVHEDETYSYYHGKWVKEVSYSLDATDKLSLDGSTPMTGDINLDGNKLKNLKSIESASAYSIVEQGKTHITFDGNVEIKASGNNTTGLVVEGYSLDETQFWGVGGNAYVKQSLIQVDHHGSSKVDDIFLKGHVIVHEGLKVASPKSVSSPLEVYAWESGKEYYRPPLTNRLLHVNPGNDTIVTSSAYVNNFASAGERSIVPKKYVDDQISNISSVDVKFDVRDNNPSNIEIGHCWFNKSTNTLNIRIA